MKETDKCPHCGAEIVRGTQIRQYYCLNCGAALDEGKKRREQDKEEGVTMRVVRRVGVISVANVYGLVMVCIGLILGLIYAFMGCAMTATDMGGLGFGFGLIGIIILPILYGIMGWVSGAIGAAIYNLVAGWIGGIQIELE